MNSKENLQLRESTVNMLHLVRALFDEKFQVKKKITSTCIAVQTSHVERFFDKIKKPEMSLIFVVSAFSTAWSCGNSYNRHAISHRWILSQAFSDQF